jgi:hypothetical protein
LVESSEGGIEIGTTFCELGDLRIADGLRAAAISAGMTVRIARRESGVRVTIEYAEDQQARAENLVRIYRRVEAAGDEWCVLDLIVKGPRHRP